MPTDYGHEGLPARCESWRELKSHRKDHIKYFTDYVQKGFCKDFFIFFPIKRNASIASEM